MSRTGLRVRKLGFLQPIRTSSSLVLFLPFFPPRPFLLIGNVLKGRICLPLGVGSASIHKPLDDNPRGSIIRKIIDCCPPLIPAYAIIVIPGTCPEESSALDRYYMLDLVIHIGEPDSRTESPPSSQSLFKGLWSRQAMPSVCEEAFGC